jgi:cytochrome b
MVKVWDPYVRISHWTVGLLVLGSFVTSEWEKLVHVHARIGYTIAALVLARVAWGWIGPAPARFRTFVRRLGEVITYARALVAGPPPLHLSHNPLGGAMVVALLAVLLAATATGAIVYAGPKFHGPLSGVLTRGTAKALKEVHEACTSTLGVLVGLHVGGVLFSSWREGQNLVLGMVTGKKRAP